MRFDPRQRTFLPPGGAGGGRPRTSPTASLREGGRKERTAFSLMEVLVALGIFAVGFVAVAAIFPAGALLQRNTATDVLARHVKRNARAIVEASRLTYDPANPADTQVDLNYYHNDPADPEDMSTPPPEYPQRSDARPFNSKRYRSLNEEWTLDDRSYPSTIADPYARQLYWVPLIRDTEGKEGGSVNNGVYSEKWEMYVFVLKRKDNAAYNTPDYSAGWPTTPSDGLGLWANGDGPNVPGVKRQNVAIGGPNGRRFNFTNTRPSDGNRELHVGDWLLYGSRGLIYKVVVADDTGVKVDGTIKPPPDTNVQNGPSGPVIWYAPPARGEDTSPCQGIFTVKPVVIKPNP